MTVLATGTAGFIRFEPKVDPYDAVIVASAHLRLGEGDASWMRGLHKVGGVPLGVTIDRSATCVGGRL